MPTAEEQHNPELEDFRRRFWRTLPLTWCLSSQCPAVPSMVCWVPRALAGVGIGLAGRAVVWPAVFQRWWDSLRNRQPNMWTLIGTGTGSAWLYSVIATVAPGRFPNHSGLAGRSRCISKPRR